jgi:GTP-binding protein
MTPKGDQPQAISKLVAGLNEGMKRQTLLGVTGSGKTFTVANVIAQVNRPTLVMSHNKTLAAQLYSEFRDIFPENAVEYFVSYYDYYQPEAYIPHTDTYIEKDSSINEDIDRLRLRATSSLLSRRDTIVVASVSAIYGLVSPAEYKEMLVFVELGKETSREEVLKKLVDIQYQRNDIDFKRGTFRARGDSVEVFLAYEENAIRIEWEWDVIRKISRIDPLTGNIIHELDAIAIYPAKHFVTSQPRLDAALIQIEKELNERLKELHSQNKLVEAQRLEQRTRYDMEMMRELGYCSGIENYSRIISGRAPGSRPECLLDYFPDDYLLVIDESHISLPQIRGMYFGDKARKTTLVDFLLKQAGSFKAHQVVAERVMDSGDLERERGITILAKNTSVKVGDTKINIVDTPGHADFGGEVERIMGMVNGALLLVDAAEGPLPQTRFVLQKALRQGLKVILVINKVDRPDARVQEVVNHAFDLFVELGATAEQAEFTIIYACARQGWCTEDFDALPSLLDGSKKGTLQPLFDAILRDIPAPPVVDSPDLQMLISNLSYSDYVGRLAIGRVLSGSVKKGQRLIRRGVDEAGNSRNENFTVSQVYTYDGLKQVEVERLESGDIGVIAGSEHFDIGDTLVSSETQGPLERIVVEKPTLGMIFSVNTSPLSGREGEAIQSRKLRDRLLKEVRTNVALRLEDTPAIDQFRVLGRGELQFAILIEQMRREGFEFMVGKPTVLYKADESGQRMEPMERAVLDMPETAVGDVTGMFQSRKGLLTKYEGGGDGTGRVRLEFDIPTRGLLGMRSKYLTLTRGAGLFSTQLLGYGPHKGDLPHRTSGALISDRAGDTLEYGLLGLEERGVLFLGPGHAVYEGMIIGEHNKDNDLNVNPCRAKKLTNIRAASAEVLVTLSGIREMSLEQCIEWIDEDEWIEVTPQTIRLRKKVLQGNLRSVKREERIT